MPISHITIPDTVPSKKNSRRNFKGVSMVSKAYAEWEGQAIPRFKAILGILEPPYVIAYEVFPPSYERRDLSNVIEGINDALGGRKKGITQEYPLADDSMFRGQSECLIALLPIVRNVDAVNPRIEVTIWSGESAVKMRGAFVDFLAIAKAMEP